MPLMDFHYKSNFENYLDAMQNASGRKLLVFANTIEDIEATIRRLMLVADHIIFNVKTYADTPSLSIFPISDKHRSPVLGAMTSMDAESHKERLPSLEEVLLAIDFLSQKAIDSKVPDSILGYEWNHSDGNWQRSYFTRTTSAVQNATGRKCHLTVGFAYEYSQPTYDWLTKDARSLLLDGHIVFAPFARSTPGSESLGERLHKARISFTRLTINDEKLVLPSGQIHPLAQLKLPYLENVPLDLLAKALRDESESLREFRRVVDRAIEDITMLENPSEIEKEMTRLKRDLLEDELDRVAKLCKRLSRMKSFSAVSAVLTTTTIAALGAMNVALPALVLPISGGLTMSLRDLYQNYEQQKEIKTSPMHFLWKLGQIRQS